MQAGFIKILQVFAKTNMVGYFSNKIRERKVKTLTRKWRDHCRTGTRKHTVTGHKYFDRHGRLYQSEESTCLWTHDKMATRRLWEGWKEGNYLKLMPGLSLVYVCILNENRIFLEHPVEGMFVMHLGQTCFILRGCNTNFVFARRGWRWTARIVNFWKLNSICGLRGSLEGDEMSASITAWCSAR